MELELETLERDGYIVLEDILDEEGLARVRASISRLYEGAKKDPLWRLGGTLHLDGFADPNSPFDAVWNDLRVAHAVRTLLGEGYRVARAHVRSPLPGEGAQALHRDYPARPASGHAVATAIVAIEDFTESNGATRVVPGSHLADHPDVPKDRNSAYVGERIIAMRAGSALIFSGHLLHSGTRNRSKSWRDALQITFARPDAVHYA